jgi:hypothetical protein
MEIKLGNVLAAFLLSCGLVIFVKMKPEITDCITAIMRTGPGHAPSDQLNGCIALGLLLLTLVGAIRLIIAERRK